MSFLGFDEDELLSEKKAFFKNTYHVLFIHNPSAFGLPPQLGLFYDL